MEDLFNTERGAGIAILGQTDIENRRFDNPLVVPKVLSLLAYKRWEAEWIVGMMIASICFVLIYRLYGGKSDLGGEGG